MSDDNKSGSDLDIFEGLGKKSSGRTSAVPPPPPGSASHIPASSQSPSSESRTPSPESRPAHARPEMKRTLMGIPGPAQPPSQNNIHAAPPPPPPAATSAGLTPSAAPSAPPHSQGRISAPPPLPSQSGSMRAVAPSSQTPPAPSKPPPPPGRGSLPNLQAVTNASTSQNMAVTQQGGSSPSQAPSAPTQKVQMPAPVSTRPGVINIGPSSSAPTPAAQLAAHPAGTNGGKLDMDWDDDDEATHVFDKEEGRDGEEAAAAPGPESRRPEHASMDDILRRPSSQAPAAGTPPPPITTLAGQFGALGQPRESNGSSPPSGQFRSGPPPSQSLRSAPPPPPPGGAAMRVPNPSTTTAPIPPPPPPGQTTTVPMHMPVRPPEPMGARLPGSMPPQMQGPHGSVPPQQQQHPSQPPYHSQPPHPISQPPQQQHSSQAPMPHMPPVSRAMEATSIVPRQQQSKAGLVIALIIGVFAAMAIAGFLLMPRTGTLVVNVADAKGAAVAKLEIIVDDKKACDSAPCIVRDVQSGVHQVKVVAQGFDPPAPRAVTIEARKDSTTEFTLSPTAGGHAGGTGIKVSGTQNGVRLLVDGKEYGPLPQELHDLTPGEHKVKVVGPLPSPGGTDRYAALEKTVDVKQDELVDLGNVALKVLKGKATIQLGTPGAKVYLVNGTNRKEVPQFPIAIDFDPNEKWQLEGKMPGMEDYSSPISFDDGQAEKTIVVTLSPKGTMPAFPVPDRTMTPPPRQAFVPPTTQPREPVVVAPKPETAPKEPAKPKEPAATAGGEAFLNINSRPASTVLLDGKPLGPTPRVKVAVTAGTHTVLFVNAEESLKKSVSVTVAAGETKAVSAKLRD